MIYKNEEEMKEKLQEEMKEARNNVRKDEADAKRENRRYQIIDKKGRVRESLD